MQNTAPTRTDLENLNEAARDARSAYLLARGSALLGRLGELMGLKALAQPTRAV